MLWPLQQNNCPNKSLVECLSTSKFTQQSPPVYSCFFVNILLTLGFDYTANMLEGRVSGAVATLCMKSAQVAMELIALWIELKGGTSPVSRACLTSSVGSNQQLILNNRVAQICLTKLLLLFYVFLPVRLLPSPCSTECERVQFTYTQ